MRLNILNILNRLSESPFIISRCQKGNTIFTQRRENINVVNFLWETERTLEILMTVKPYKIFRDMKINTASWPADTHLSRREQQLFGKKQEVFPAVTSISTSGIDLKLQRTGACTCSVTRKHPEERITSTLTQLVPCPTNTGNAQKLPSGMVTGWTSHSLSHAWLKHVSKVMFQITAIMKLLSNHSWDHMPGNIFRNKRTNSLTVEISFSTEKHVLNRWV